MHPVPMMIACLRRCPPPRTLVFLGLAAAALAALGPARAASSALSVAATASTAAAAATPASCPALLRHTVPRLQDEKPQALCQYAGKVLLIVNTASYCGFTGQFKGLETLNEKYAPRGLVVMGFPSNDFRQEDADARKTAEVCFNTYGVKFPMFATMPVRGAGAHPLFAQLAKATGQPPAWNFNKYLVGRDGIPLAHFGSGAQPTGIALAGAIERALVVPAGR
jgi:glutathione peroxidase